MARSEDRTFSLGWVFVSYFMICGGLVVATVALAAVFGDDGSLSARSAGYLACGLGGAIGGLFSGRASSHYSLLEPGVAGALVIGSVYALVKYTAIGPFAFAFAEDAIARESLILGGLSCFGGLVGAALGEATTGGAASPSAVRWLGLGAFLTLGAVLFTTVLSNILFIDQSLRDPEFLRQIMRDERPVSEDDIASVFLLALAGASLLGGLVTQMAAPRRMLIVCGLGVFLAIGGGLLATLVLAGAADSDAVLGSLIMGVAAAVLGLVGAVVGWMYRRIIGAPG